MVSISDLINESYDDIKSDTKFLEKFILQKRFELERDLKDNLNEILEEFRIHALVNLTIYGSKYKERHEYILEAFEIARKLFGYVFNPSGSFTMRRAKELLSTDLSITDGDRRKEIRMKEGSILEELENGDVNWRAMKGFFYGNRGTIEKAIGKEEAKIFYKKLARLFSYTKDPTMPEGRPYISDAAEDSNNIMQDRVVESIERIFGSNGRWHTA